MSRRPGLSLPAKQIEGKLSFLAENKLNLEIQLNWESAERFPEPLLEKTLAWKRDTASEITIHSPFMDMVPGGVDPLMREGTLKRLHQSAVLAKRFEASAMVVHPGYDEMRYWMDTEGFVRRSVETWKRLLEMTNDHGCLIALENIFERRPELLKRIVEEVGSERFGICFDAGHFNMFSKAPLAEWMVSLGGMIVELHLHNNFGEHDDHNGMGKGTFDFYDLFSRLDEVGADPILTMEPHQEEGISDSLEFLSALAETRLAASTGRGKQRRQPGDPS